MIFKKFFYKKVNSTNDLAIKKIKTGISQGIIVADYQKKGRGQYGKKWISYNGNLFVSFFYNLKNFKISLNKLTKINCLIVKKCISQYYKKKIDFKKPNDLLIQKKKICGILQEKVNKFNNTYLIVGIGVNLIKSPFIRNYPTTHLRELIKKDISKKKFELKLKKIFENNLKRLIKKRV